MVKHESNGLWLAAIALLTVLCCLPFLHAVYDLGDEAVLLNGAERMLHGEILYKQFFEFLPPGGFFLTAAWLSAAGISVLSARLFGILVITLIACFTFLTCRRATKNAALSFALVIGYVISSQGHQQTQMSHHWFTCLFSIIPFWAVFSCLERPASTQFYATLAGVMAAAAVMITPTCGALAWAAAAYAFLRQGRGALLAFLAASTIAPVCVLGFLLSQASIGAAFADCIGYTALHYSSIQSVPFGYGINLQNYPIVWLFPFAGLLAVVVCLLGWRTSLTDQRLQLCIVFAVAAFIGCFPRPDVGRITFATPLAMPLFAYCLSNLLRRCRPIYAAIFGEALIFCWAPSALAFGIVVETALHAPETTSPRGDVSLMSLPGASDMLSQIKRLPAGVPVFFYPYMPLMSFLTGREQVSKYDLFTPGYTTAFVYEDTCLAVMQTASWTVIDRHWIDPKSLKTAFPALQNPTPPETEAFEQALSRGFDLVSTSGTFELRRRNASAGPALCTGIIN